MNMHNQTKRITDGALMVAIIGMLLFINRQLAGALEYAMYWILSFPILIYTVKYGLKAALIPAAAMMLISVIIAMPTTMFYLASALLCGLMYGYGSARKWPNAMLLLSTGIVTFFSYLVTMVLFAGVFGYDPVDDLIMAEQLGEVLHLGNVNMLQIALICSILLTIITSVLQTICVHLLAVMTLRRMKLPAPSIKSIFELRMPNWIGWISICIILLFYLRNMLELDGNILILIVSLYSVTIILLCAECVLDLLCASLYMKKRSMGIVLMFLCIGLMIWEPARNLICLIGIGSILLHIRQRWK